MECFFFTDRKVKDYINIVSKEYRCLENLIIILASLVEVSDSKYIMENVERNLLEKYIKHCIIEHSIDAKKAKSTRLNLKKVSLENIDLSGMDLTMVDLEQTNLKDTNLTASIWQYDDINKMSLQLKEANFTYLFAKEVNGYKNVYIYRRELFPDDIM